MTIIDEHKDFPTPFLLLSGEGRGERGTNTGDQMRVKCNIFASCLQLSEAIQTTYYFHWLPKIIVIIVAKISKTSKKETSNERVRERERERDYHLRHRVTGSTYQSTEANK